MAATTTTTAHPSEQVPFYDRWFLELINDPRDLPFVHLMIGCAAVACLGIGLLFSGEYFWWLLPVYYAIWGLGYLDRFILMLHCTEHRPLFKAPRYRVLNHVIPWLLGPFFGETPDTYFGHHLGMHHPENNQFDDLSSTMKYRRDSFLHWLRYWFRFQVVVAFELPIYHLRRGNRRLALRCFGGEALFWICMGLLCLISLKWTLMVFVIPVWFVRTLMMAGNWGQHAFVDPSDPANAYKNSITCINCRYNRRCFNDGYHIHHHIKMRCHWSEYPEEFESSRAEYGRQDAIVFEGIDFFMVWLFLMFGAWKTLAKRFVQLPGAPVRTQEEVISFLQSRMVPIARP